MLSSPTVISHNLTPLRFIKLLLPKENQLYPKLPIPNDLTLISLIQVKRLLALSLLRKCDNLRIIKDSPVADREMKGNRGKILISRVNWYINYGKKSKWIH